MLAIDISNYSSPLAVTTLQQWLAVGVGRVIIQAFPPSYNQFAEQRHQTQTCRDAAMPLSNYVYDYLASPGWRDGALDGIQLLEQQEGVRPLEVHLDEEDVDPSAERMTPSARVAAIWRGINEVRDRGLPLGELYTGPWWYVPRTENYTGFAAAGIGLWDSDFDGIADTELSWQPYGGWTHRRLKQFRGTSVFEGVGGVDVNVLSIEEEAELSPESDPDTGPYPHMCQRYMDAIEHAVNRLQIELERKTAAGRPATLRRTLIGEIQRELYAALQA